MRVSRGGLARLARLRPKSIGHLALEDSQQPGARLRSALEIGACFQRRQQRFLYDIFRLMGPPQPIEGVAVQRIAERVEPCGRLGQLGGRGAIVRGE